MADQQRKVSLIFEANTNQAKQDINNLFAALQKVQAMPSTLIDPTNIKNASQAALELQEHLQRAVNVDTGKLDLSRFSASLTAANTSLDKYKKTLIDSGPAGENAFKQVMRGINSAETSTIRLTKGMRDFVNTMKNTVKWQFSSSLMHGFMGAVQSAYGYAKALDASLNNIRIVTGQSSEEMARFAVEANRSAQALSTTTTRYAEASLIFYQQGLSDKAVKERTDAVIKMANVTGEAAADVSSYMTAIWNNFDDGSKSIEYYADVITKLGAATAASSEEIAGGLEKFAAIGNTIGLSYEYATAMITTIVDKTRQSEDIVGTALKTILARVQGLNLGETLDDGTNMNKYSEALSKVGISIKTASGEIKDMDTILDELGSKWQTLSKDTQIALAQVVGGVRQYNQIIALMDNWSAFESNVNLAETASGSLDEQANIYAESWEAARHRVTTAAQGIYDALINEDVFIKLDNLFTHLLNTINGVVKGMGGMMPILGTIGGFLTQKVAREVPVMLNNAAQNIAILSGKAQNKALGSQKEITASATDLRDLYAASDPKAAAEYETIRRVSVMREKLIANQHKMNSQEIEHYESLIRNEETLGAIFAEHQGILGTIEKENQALKEQAVLKATENLTEAGESGYDDNQEAEEKEKIQFKGETIEVKKKKDLYDEAYAEAYDILIKSLEKDKKELETILSEKKLDDPKVQMRYDQIQARIGQYEKGSLKTQDFWDEVKRMTLESLKAKLKEPATNIVEASTKLGNFKGIQSEIKSLFDSNTFKNAENKTEVLKQKFDSLKNALNLAENDEGVQKVTNKIKDLGEKADLTEDDIKAVNQALDELVNKQVGIVGDTQKKFIEQGGSVEDAEKLGQSGEKQGYLQGRTDRPPEPPEIPDKGIKITERLTEAAGMAMSVYGSFNAILAAHTVLVDENAGAMEKLGSTIGALISLMQTANSITNLLNNSTIFQNLIAKSLTKNMDENNAKIIQEIYLKEGLAAATKKASDMNVELNKTMKASIWGLIATALIAFIAGVISWQKKEKEMRKEMAEEAIEESNAINEEVKTNEALINSYERAIYLYEKGEGSKDDIRKATEELCEAYDIENEQLLLQAERYDDITRAIREKRKEELKKSADTAQKALNLNSSVLKDAALKGDEAYENKGSNNSITFDPSIDFFASFSKQETSYRNAIEQAGLKTAQFTVGDETASALYFNTEASDEGILQLYQDINTAIKIIEQEADKNNELYSNSKLYKALVSYRNQLQESVETTLTQREIASEALTQLEVLNTLSLDEEIISLEEYKALEDSIVSNLNYMEEKFGLTNDQLREMVRTALEGEVVLSELARQAILFEQASAASGLSEETLKNYYDDLTDEEKELFFSINFNTARSEEALESQIEVLQEVAENNSIRLKIDTFTNASEQFKKVESVQDYKDFKEKSGIEWGNEEKGIISYNEFLRKSRQEQEKWLYENIPSESDLNSSTNDAITAYTAEKNRLAQQQDYAARRSSKSENIIRKILDDELEEEFFNSLKELDPADGEYLTKIKTLTEGTGVSPTFVKDFIEMELYAKEAANGVNSLEQSVDDLNAQRELDITYQFLEARENIANLVKELQGLKAGETISAESYQTFAKYFNDEHILEKAFTQTAEGTYELIAGFEGITISWQQMVNAVEGEENLFSPKEIASYITNLAELQEFISSYDANMGELDQYGILSDRLGEIISKVQTLEELDQVVGLYDTLNIDESDAYSQALINIAQGYDSCNEAAKNYANALNALEVYEDDSQLQADAARAEDNLRALILLEESAKKYGFEVENLNAQSKRLAEAYKLTAEEAAKLAVKNQRMNKGIDTLTDNWEDWKKALKSSDKLTDKYIDAVVDCTSAIADLVGASEDLELPDEFFNDKNMALIEKAIKGDTDAINQLGVAVGIATVEALEFDSGLASITSALDQFRNEDIELDLLSRSKFEEDKNIVLQGIRDIQNGIIDAGDAMGADWVAALNRLAITTGMTVEQMNGLLGSLGVQAKVETSYIKQPMQVPTYTEYTSAVGTEQFQQGEDAFGNPNWVTYTTVRKFSVPGEPMEVEGYIPVAQISTVDNPLTAEISSSTVPAATYNGKRGSVSTPASTGSGRGGGGGGRSKPTGTKKDNSEKERYRSIKNILEDLTAEYEKISKAADRAFGKARIKLLQQQEAELRALAASQQLYLEQIEDYLASDKANLQQVANFAQVSIKYNGDGTIINYDEIQDAMYRDYNSHINEQGEVIDMEEEAWEKYEEQWQNMMDLIDKYEETQDLRKEALQQLQDYIDELYDLRLEKVTYAVEIDIDAKDFKLEFLDSLLERVRDDAWEAAEAIELMGEKAATMLEKNETYHSGIRDILMNHTTDILDANGNVLKAADLTEADVAGYFAGDPAALAKLEELGKNGGFTADEVDKLKEYHEALMELSEDMLLLREEVYQIALDAFEQFGEEMDEIIEKMEHLISITQHYKNIVDIVGKKNLGISNDLLESVGQSIVTQSTNQLEASRIRKETIAEEIRMAEEKLQLMRDQGLEEDAKLWEDNLKVMYESLREAEEEFMSSWENTMEVINEQFELMVSNVSETFSDMLAGPMRSSLEQLQGAFDRQNDLNSLHLDDYEKIYRLSKLNRDIINSIDETDNIKAKEELAKLQEEINKLEEDGVKVSEYQTEDLRRRYELRLAELALIEAQNAKSNVRMDRDADGNWNYVYTADEEAVRSAEQNYEDKLFALQEANTEYIREMENLILQSQIELQQKIEEITMDETLSMEEKYALIQEYTDYYSQKIAEYSSEMQLALDNNKWLYEEEWKRYSEMTGYKISAEQNFIDKFDETVLSQTTGFKTLGELNTNYETATTNMLTNLATAFTTWKDNVSAAMGAAGTSVNTFGSDMSKMVESITKEGGLSDQLLKDMQSLSSDIKTEFQNITDAVANWALEYSQKITDAIAKNDALITSFAGLIEQWSQYQEIINTPPVDPPDTTKPETEQDPEYTDRNTGGGEDPSGGRNTSGGGTTGGTNSSGPKYIPVTYTNGFYGSYSDFPPACKNYSWTPKNVLQGSTISLSTGITVSGCRVQSVIFKSGASSGGKVNLDAESVSIAVMWEPIPGGAETGGLFGGELGSYKQLLKSYDTGGYTGSWGKEGRMAMLHEKELVLNKEDTKNMLKSVGIIRRIAEVIDLNALASSGATSRGRLQGQFVKELEGFEQNVNIEAHFPNATDKNEIYEAFNEMINMAVQYANRK